jgi:hypothetical protein
MPVSPAYTIRYAPHTGWQSVIYRLQIPTISNTAILKFLKLENFPSAAVGCIECEYQIHQYLNASGIIKCYNRDIFYSILQMLLADFGGR